MGLIELIILLAIVGVLLYFIETYVPMAPPVKTIIRIVVVFAIVLWLLRVFVGDIPIGRIR